MLGESFGRIATDELGLAFLTATNEILSGRDYRVLTFEDRHGRENPSILRKI